MRGIALGRWVRGGAGCAGGAQGEALGTQMFRRVMTATQMGQRGGMGRRP